MDVELKWSAPPEEALLHPPSSGFYGQVAKALRARPGEWAQVPREFASEGSAKNTATRIRTGRMATMPKGHFEAVSHEKDLWVRAVPVEDQPKDDEDAAPGSVHPIRKAVPTSPRSGEAAKIRAWGVEQGKDVPKHGRLPQELLDAYDEAHP